MADYGETAWNARGIMLGDVCLSALLGAGVTLLLLGIVPEYRETLVVLGAALVVTSCIGGNQMVVTRSMANGLHEGFDKRNEILKEIASTQKEIASTQKEIASKQRKILKDIASTRRNMASTQKHITSFRRNAEGIHKK